MPWLPLVLSLSAVLVAVVVLLGMRGRRTWRVQACASAARLDAQPGPALVTHFDPAELRDLPAPVQRYLRLALTAGQPLVSGVRLTQSGRISLSDGGLRWQAFTAVQQVATCRPGWLWNARIALLAGLSLWCRDDYLAGAGQSLAAVSGLLGTARPQGGAELARSGLMRFLAEAPWYPTALLPSQGVRWVAVNGRQADATLADGAVSVTLRFRFGESGLVESVRADARARRVGRRLVMAPWEGRWKDWASRDGMRVPLTGEAAWLLLGGRQVYWRGRLGKLRYRFSA